MVKPPNVSPAQGDANALRCCLALAQKIRGIMAAFPKDTPVISSHPIVGNMAVACGFTKVINLIFDNYPQWLEMTSLDVCVCVCTRL